MKIYHYDFETGQYLGEGVADPSPLETDVWLIPAYATDVAPPETGVDEYAIFIEGNWAVFKAVEPEVDAPAAEEVAPPFMLQG
jgi:hypothetical protein